MKKNESIKLPSGLLLVKKPLGYTSHDVVGKLRRILKTKSVGHTGTLDPLAEGLMVILVNEATKLSSFFLEGDKGYEVVFGFGVATDTLDITGEIKEKINGKEIDVNVSDIVRTACNVIGEMNIPVPIYSATKVDGKKLYEYAREGRVVDVPIKAMNFMEVRFLNDVELKDQVEKIKNQIQLKNQEITDYINNQLFRFYIKCSKGTFIRSWVELVGKELDLPATMVGLRRVYSEPFDLQDAKSLDQLQEMLKDNLDFNSKLNEILIPMEKALQHMTIINVKGKAEQLLFNGQIAHDLKDQLIRLTKGDVEIFYQIHSSEKKLLAIIHFIPDAGFRIKRVFH